MATGLSLDTPPKAAVRTVEDEYFGVKISDPYRWLENIKDSPEAQGWLRAQADYSRKLIDSMPGYEKLKVRVNELINSRPATIAEPRRLANGNLFYLKTPANQNTAKLCFRRSASDDGIVLVDPDDFQKRTGLPHAINFFEPSWDGKYGCQPKQARAFKPRQPAENQYYWISITKVGTESETQVRKIFGAQQTYLQ